MQYFILWQEKIKVLHFTSNENTFGEKEVYKHYIYYIPYKLLYKFQGNHFPYDYQIYVNKI